MYFNSMNTKNMDQYQLSSGDPQKRKSPIIIQSLTQTRTNQLIIIKRILQQITQITSENINSIKEKKSAISQTLRSKIDTKSRKSIYDLLDQHNKNFLLNSNNDDDSLTDGSNMPQNITSAIKQKEIQKQKMFEFKQWIKNPEHFESYFNTKLTKETLKQILNPKYELLKMLSKIESFLQQFGLKYCRKGCNNNFNLALIDSNYMEEFLKKIQSLITANKNKIAEQKQRILNIMLLNMQYESQPRTINFYMQNFINLYQSLNSFSPYTRFTTTQTSMQEFNFSIDHTTVVLRNPQLNQQKSYEKMTYESEFAFINDGEYVFNNEYRASYLCWEDVNEMERSVNTMIGSQYVMMVNEEDEFECCQQEIQGKLIEINNYLRSDKKISLRLRLNSVEFDKITIKILQSRTWQQFIEDKKESCHEFNFQIIPDQGDNLHIYGFTSSKAQSHSESINYPHQQQESKLNDLSIIQQQQHSQQTHLVLEDDIISLFLTSDENYIVCWNETRNHLIHKIHVQKPVINLVENLPFQSQLYVGIVLYTTVPEIEIYDHK